MIRGVSVCSCPSLGIMKHLRCRCLGEMTLYPQTQLSTIPQTQQLQMPACIQDFCTAITFSYAIRSQSVLTTNQQGVSTVFSTAHAYFHNLLTQFLWTCAAILSNLAISSTVDSFAFEELQIASTAMHDQSRVSKLRHNSRTKLRIKFSNVLKRDNTVFYLYC